ncbi:hypothetical protein CC2G_011376 [Coprinopsis cinerea AmutBmut pab1-1]|nr:hypothetical protein CC2G_011376 [Coprinopsis cinerea AmutBmut pab1-1]
MALMRVGKTNMPPRRLQNTSFQPLNVLERGEWEDRGQQRDEKQRTRKWRQSDIKSLPLTTGLGKAPRPEWLQWVL